MTDEQVQAQRDTQAWLERAVIGLNLCPFAKAVHVKRQVRYVVCESVAEDEILQLVEQELKFLAEVDPLQSETTLLVLPNALPDFMDFNDFVGEAEQVLADLDLEGTLQVASFHPDFQFAGTSEDDITNFTNRSPYPTLHLIREASIDRAVAAFPEADVIWQTNMQTMEELGDEGWRALKVQAGDNPADISKDST